MINTVIKLVMISLFFLPHLLCAAEDSSAKYLSFTSVSNLGYKKVRILELRDQKVFYDGKPMPSEKLLAHGNTISELLNWKPIEKKTTCAAGHFTVIKSVIRAGKKALETMDYQGCMGTTDYVELIDKFQKIGL